MVIMPECEAFLAMANYDRYLEELLEAGWQVQLRRNRGGGATIAQAIRYEPPTADAECFISQGGSKELALAGVVDAMKREGKL